MRLGKIKHNNRIEYCVMCACAQGKKIQKVEKEMDKTEKKPQNCAKNAEKQQAFDCFTDGSDNNLSPYGTL